MARPRTLTIGPIEIPILEAENYAETLEKVGGFVLLRTVLGSALRQCNWVKHHIAISAGGSLPPALLEIDHVAMHVLKLAAPQAKQSTSNIITLPTERRADVPLEGYAVMDVDDFIIESPVSLLGDVATVTTVPGAVAYRVNYWPQFTVFVDPPSTNVDRRGSVHQWTMNCEEV